MTERRRRLVRVPRLLGEPRARLRRARRRALARARARGHREPASSRSTAGPTLPDRSLEPLRARLRAPAPRRRAALRDPQRDPARARSRLERGGDRRRPGRRRPHVRARARARRDLRATRSSSRAIPTTSPRRSTAASSSARSRPPARRRPRPVRLDPPEGVEAVLVMPDETVPTAEARAALPRRGRARRRGRQRRRGEPARARYRALRPDADRPRARRPAAPAGPSPALSSARWSSSSRRRELGALGATISGAGPAVMLWCFWQDTGKVVEAAGAATAGWAEVRRVPFSPSAADVDRAC